MQLSVGVWQPYTGGGTEYCCSPAREPRAAVSETRECEAPAGVLVRAGAAGGGVGRARAEPQVVRSGSSCVTAKPPQLKDYFLT